MYLTQRSRGSIRRAPRKSMYPRLKVLPTGKQWRLRSHRQVRAFFSIMKHLPQALALRVLEWVDWPTIGVVMETPPHGWWIQDLVGNLEMSMVVNIVRNQYRPLTQIFVREENPWKLVPHTNRWVHASIWDYAIIVHDLRSTTRAAVAAFEVGLPLMNFPTELQYWISHMWLFFGSPIDADDFAQETWDYFSSLPRWKQLGLSEIFDRLVPAFLDMHPVKFPQRCMTCTGPWGRRCGWRTPQRTIDELENLGVIEIITKQLLMMTMWRLLTMLNNRGLPLDKKIEARARRCFSMYPSPNFWIKRNMHSHHPTWTNPRRRQVFFLDRDTYGIVMGGRKGAGNIHLMHVGPSANFLRQLDSALALPEGETLELSDWNQIWPGGVPSYTIRRVPYWNWVHWKEELCLDQLFG